MFQTLQQEHIPSLLQAIHQVSDDPENAAAQQNLINASNEFVPVRVFCAIADPCITNFINKKVFFIQ